MTTTITDGVTTVTPQIIDGYKSLRVGRNITHELLDPTAPIAVSVRASNPRSGTLRMLFAAEADASEAEVMLAAAGVFTLASDERTTLDMTFTAGDVERELEDDTRDAWWVTASFQEVP